MKILCRLFDHRWVTYQGYRWCRRCDHTHPESGPMPPINPLAFLGGLR